MKTTMPKKWRDKLITLCYIQSCSTNEKLMFEYLTCEILKLGLTYTTDTIGNIIVIKGEATTYPCVVAHMDTVHDFVKDYTIYSTKDDKLFARSSKVQTGIGGDDKCGIFACLYLLETLPIIKVVFFSKEESGCQGAKHIRSSFFTDCRYLIELDRNGSKDFIDIKLDQKTVSHQFSSEVGAIKKEFGFKSTEGTITDVVRLWLDGVGISCVNISAGYYSPHSSEEWINTKDLWHSIKFTKSIIQTLKLKIYKSLQKQTIVKSSYIYNTHKINKWCPECKTMKVRSSGQLANWSNNVETFKCYVCLRKDDKYSLCKECYKWVLIKDLCYNNDVKKMTCSDCRKDSQDKGICSVCNNPIYVQHAHQIDGDVLICYSCYIDNVQIDNLNDLNNKETCYDCNKKVSKSCGKYDGELFICNSCTHKFDKDMTEEGIVYNKTDICDRCYKTTDLTKGKYTGKTIKIGSDRIPQFICNKCLN